LPNRLDQGETSGNHCLLVSNGGIGVFRTPCTATGCDLRRGSGRQAADSAYECDWCLARVATAQEVVV